MVLIGLVLLVAGAVFGIDLAANNRFKIRDLDVFGSNVGIHSADRLFVLGAIVGAVIILGVVVTLAGLRRKGSRAAQRRRDRRRTTAAVNETEAVRAQNADLRQQLGTQRLEVTRPEGGADEHDVRGPIPAPPGAGYPEATSPP